MTSELAPAGDARHLWILLGLIVGGGVVALLIRGTLVPESFGRLGPYRAAALAELKAKPSKWQSDSVCLECHVKVKAEREDALHLVVACTHCHGFGTKHVAEARLAKKNAGMKVRPAEYKEIFIRPVRGDWRFLKKTLRSRRDLYDRKGRRYAKDLVEKILKHKTTRVKDGEVQGGD